MALAGTIFWSGMLGLQQARFDVLYVWSPLTGQYDDIMDVISQLPLLPDQIAEDEARITALEANAQALDE